MKKLISMLLALCMVLAMGIVAFAEETIEVATYEELVAAFANDESANVKMTTDITADATQSSGYGKAGIVLNAGAVLDGNGFKLTINGANGTWDSVIAMKGGEVKNLTIAGAFRGVFMPGANGDVVIDNCVFKDVVYTFNSDAGSKDYTVTIKNSALNGWTSFSDVHKSVTFENCTFGEGSGYAFCRPYQATTFTGCDFEEGFEFDNQRTAASGLEFNGCKYADEPLSAENNDMFYLGGKVVIDGSETDVTNYEAQIGDTKYLTLAEAISAVGAGDVVIELLNDATLDYNAREAYGTDDTTSVTINGNNKTLTLNQKDSDWSSLGLKNPDAKFIFKNMTIEKTGYGDTSGAWNTHTINVTSKLDMEEVTVNNSINVEKDANLKNVTINEANDYYGLWITADGQTVNAEGLEINGGRGIKIADQYVNDPAQVTLNVKDSVFSTAKKAAVLVSSKAGADITAENVNIENVAEDTVNFVWVDEDWIKYYGATTVKGASVVGECSATGDIIRAYLNEKGRITVDMEDVIFYENVTLNLYSGDELLTTARLDTEKHGPGYYAELTGSIGVTDQSSDSWPVDKWTPYEGVVPTEVVLVIDGVVADYVDIIHNGNPDYNNSDKLDEKEWNAVGGINPAPLVKPENAIVIDLTGKDKTEDEANPNTGAPVMMPVAAVFAVLSGAAVLKRK